MAIDGHPWATDRLDSLRARQRRWLRDQPVTFRGDRFGPIPIAPPPKRESDRALLETLLRLDADRRIPSLGSDLSAPDVEAAGLVHEWLAVAGEMTTMDGPDLDNLLSTLSNDATHARNAGQRPVPTYTDAFQIREVIALLVWADDLAGDYSDDRIARAT